MNLRRMPVRRLAEAGLIAALYAALTLAFSWASFGPIQVRVSEALTILPVFMPAAVPGLAVGCAVSNLIGLGLGMNAAGAWDILFGSLTTLAAAALTRALRGVLIRGLPVAATLPPVLLNALVVGLELTVVYYGFSWPMLGINMLQVGAGQCIACIGGGLLLHKALARSGAARLLHPGE